MPPYFFWSKRVVYSNSDVLLVCAHTKDHGEHRVFNVYRVSQKKVPTFENP